MINKMKEVHTYGDVLNVLEEYEKEKKINEAWNNSENLYKTQYQSIRSSNVIGYISSFEEDYKFVRVKIPIISTGFTVKARLSPILRAWCKAWKEPKTYFSTINNSPIIGNISIEGNDFTTTNLPISIAGVSSIVPPALGGNAAGPVTCTCTGPAVQSAPVITNVINGVYTQSGKYPKTGGEANIHTDEEKFSQTPKPTQLWPFNAISEDWRLDEEFLQPGDKVVVLVLDGTDCYFVTDVFEFRS